MPNTAPCHPACLRASDSPQGHHPACPRYKPDEFRQEGGAMSGEPERPFPVCSECGWAVEISTSQGCATCGPSTEVRCLNRDCHGSKEDMREVWSKGPQREVRRIKESVDRKVGA